MEKELHEGSDLEMDKGEPDQKMEQKSEPPTTLKYDPWTDNAFPEAELPDEQETQPASFPDYKNQENAEALYGLPRSGSQRLGLIAGCFSHVLFEGHMFPSSALQVD